MRLQNITLATTVLVLCLSAIDTDNAQATISENQLKPVSFSVGQKITTQAQENTFISTSAIEYKIAQASKEQDAVSDDEMLDALQERQKKIDRSLEKIRKITGAEAESETPSTEGDSETGDEISMLYKTDKIKLMI